MRIEKFVIPHNSERAGHPAKVLIVDDDPHFRRGLADVFKDIGCSVSTADSGERAVAVLQRESYDLIFMDCRMPGMDGPETARAIRELALVYEQPAIIGMSVDGGDYWKRKCLNAGMQDFLDKSARLEDFEGALSRYAPA